MYSKGPQSPLRPVQPVAAAHWRLILQDIHCRWIKATEEPQVGPRYTGTMGLVAFEFPSP